MFWNLAINVMLLYFSNKFIAIIWQSIALEAMEW